jgi:L-iditol 2-dehydrogenase
MRAGVLVEPGRMECREFTVPSPAAGRVVVRSHRASICGSDLHVVYDGFSHWECPAPAGYPGHEGVGEVLAVGAGVSGIAPGDRVLTVPMPPEAMCFAELQDIAAGSLIVLPADGDLDRLLLAQQLGTVLYASRRFLEGLAPGGTAVVIGAGSVGLYFLQALRRAGFGRVIVSDLEPHRLEIARELGAAAVVRAPSESVVEAALDLTSGAGAELVIEAAGYDATRAQAVEAAAVGGRVGFFGFPERKGDAVFPFESAFRRALTMMTSVGTQSEPGLRSFREAADAIHRGDYEVDYMLAPAFPVEEIQEAMEAARARAGVKVSVTFG